MGTYLGGQTWKVGPDQILTLSSSKCEGLEPIGHPRVIHKLRLQQ